MPVTDSDYPCDVFISHAKADRAWVQGYLLPALGLPPERVITPQDFRPGAPVVAEFERAVMDSRYTVLALSPAYLADEWATFGELLVSHVSVAEQRGRLIPLLLQPCTLPLRVDFRVRLDCTDEANWEQETARLRVLLDQPEPAPERIPCPYPGMVPFRAEDACFFYGRDPEVQQMLHHLRHQRCLFVIGPSGCGKSSLVFAGLLPKLARSNYFPQGFWLVREMRPGDQPLPTLGQAIGGDSAQPAQVLADLLAAHPPAQRLLVVIDQFEELFTQTGRAEQSRFIAALQTLRTMESCTLLIAMRADFYPDLMNSDLWPVDPSQRLEIAPPRGEALRQAIQQPAADVGVHLEAGLLERLLADAADEPGVLPMLQETLVLLWGEKQRRLLSLSSYERQGSEGRSGLVVAVSTKADAALADLSDEQQAIARRIFLRLVQFGEGRADTRRQQPVPALSAAGDEPHLFDQTLRHLTDNRLLTLSGEKGDPSSQVDIAHEALIAGWPTLRQWLTERREVEQTRRRLEARAADWVRLGRGSGGLLDEVELLEAERWLESPDGADLGYDEALLALVKASRAAQEETEAQQRRAARFRLGALAAIAALIIAALGIGLWSTRQVARQQREAAATAQALLAKAEEQARIATSRQLAVQSQSVLEEHPQRSLLLAVEALTTTLQAGEPRVPAAEQALRQALANTGGRPLHGHKGDIRAVAISPDGHWLATGSGATVSHGTAWHGTVRLWDLTAPDPIEARIVLWPQAGSITAIAFSPDNRWLVAGIGGYGTVFLWELTDPDLAAEPLVLHGHGAQIWGIAFSPSSRWLVTGSADGTARVWDLANSGPLANSIILRGHEGSVRGVAISPDGRQLATGSDDNTARLWDLTAPDPAAESVVLRGHTDGILTVAFSPDNHWLATGSYDDTARLWDLTVSDPAAAPIVLRGHESVVQVVAFSPDGYWLATGSQDASARLWDLTAPNPAAGSTIMHGHEGIIWAVTFSPDSHWLVTSSDDNTARLWDLTAPDPAATPTVLRGHEGAIQAVAISPDSRWLATGSWDRTARLWDLSAPSVAAAPAVMCNHAGWIEDVVISHDGHWLATGGRLWDLTVSDPAANPIVLRGREWDIEAVAFSSDSRWLATGSYDGTVRLWDLTAPDPAAAPIFLRGHEDRVNAVVFSPDGHWLATGSYDGTARLWNLTVPDLAAAPMVLRGHEGGINAAAVSSDGHSLVTGGWDNTARLWDLSAPDPAAAPIVLRAHTDGILTVAFSPDNCWLATGGNDGTICLWDLSDSDPAAEPAVLRVHEGAIEAVAFSPDNHWLVTASRLWDLTAYGPAADPIVLRGHEMQVSAVAFSPDSHWLATGSGGLLVKDSTVRLWDLTTVTSAANPIVLRGHETGIIAVAFSPEGYWLVTGSRDGTVRLWDLRLDELVDLACRTAGRNLTREEWEQYFPGQGYRQTCEQWPLEEE